MIKTTSFIALGASFALAACASTGTNSSEMSEKSQARLAQFDKTGETKNCLNLRQVDHIKPLSSNVFLIEARGKKFYLNETNGKCSGAERGRNALTYRTTMNSLCKGEIIRVFDTSADFTVGSCSLGNFQELTKKPNG